MAESDPPPEKAPINNLPRWISLVSLALVILKLVFKDLTIDNTILGLLVIAMVPAVFPLLSSLKLPGGIELNFKEIKQQLETVNANAAKAKQSADLALEAVATGVGGKGGTERKGASIVESDMPGDVEVDTRSGKFGGQSVRDGFALHGRVSTLPNNPDLFEVRIWVERSPGAAMRGEFEAVFYLHQTFRVPVIKVRSERGRAELQRIAYGAFTVGVEVNGEVRLELNLATLEGAPQAFKDR
jgi:hypothetical protein